MVKTCTALAGSGIWIPATLSGSSQSTPTDVGDLHHTRVDRHTPTYKTQRNQSKTSRKIFSILDNVVEHFQFCSLLDNVCILDVLILKFYKNCVLGFRDLL